MGNFGLDFWLLFISIIILLFLSFYLFKRKDKTQLRGIFIINCVLTLIISLGVLIQTVCYNLFTIDPMIFENFIYIGTCFLPVSIFFTGSIFITIHNTNLLTFNTLDEQLSSFVLCKILFCVF